MPSILVVISRLKIKSKKEKRALCTKNTDNIEVISYWHPFNFLENGKMITYDLIDEFWQAALKKTNLFNVWQI